MKPHAGLEEKLLVARRMAEILRQGGSVRHATLIVAEEGLAPKTTAQRWWAQVDGFPMPRWPSLLNRRPKATTPRPDEMARLLDGVLVQSRDRSISAAYKDLVLQIPKSRRPSLRTVQRRIARVQAGG